MAISLGNAVEVNDVMPGAVAFNMVWEGYPIRAEQSEKYAAGDLLLASGAFCYVIQINDEANNPPASGTEYTWTNTDTDSLKKVLWDGKVSINASNSNNKLVTGGWWLFTPPNATVKITWSSNAGASWSRVELLTYTISLLQTIASGTTVTGTGVYTTSSATTNRTTTITTNAAGAIYAGFFVGTTSVTQRWISISKILVNDVQVFPKT